jgi:diguanylate cyclase (GGDEF)-like protein
LALNCLHANRKFKRQVTQGLALAIATLGLLCLRQRAEEAINDSLGHLKGDQFLISIAQIIQVCIRSTDIAARLGGDEFTILLEGIQDISDVIKVAERIQQELRLPLRLVC